MVVNSDDSIGSEMLADKTMSAEKYSYSITAINATDNEHSVYTESVEFQDEGIACDVVSPWGPVRLRTTLIGQFNLSNCLAVFTLLGALGIDHDSAIDELAKLKPVAGRMECFGGQDKPMVVVDYAHTPDALKHALQALRPHTQHHLWVVFGCGGDRDRGKRPQMAAIAEEYADVVVLTSDNPRSETLIDIIDEMRQGLSDPTACTVELNRAHAIKVTMSRAVIGDVILVAGKGHEQYQQVGQEKLPHSDITCVVEGLEKGKWS
jgi:UDP-N-acetylmuramoyl-L-alanyl-D-glutamate--2,6-diaminopimelate ligase